MYIILFESISILVISTVTKFKILPSEYLLLLNKLILMILLNRIEIKADLIFIISLELKKLLQLLRNASRNWKNMIVIIYQMNSEFFFWSNVWDSLFFKDLMMKYSRTECA